MSEPTRAAAAATRGLPALEHALRGALVLSVLLVLGGGLVVWAWGAALERALGPRYWGLLAVLGVAAGAGLAALASRRGAPGKPALLLRAAFSLAVGAHVVLLAAFPSWRAPYVAACFALAAGAFAVLVLAVPRAPRPLGAVLRVLDRVAFSLALGVCMAEIALRILAFTAHPAILAETTDAAAWIRANRLRPGAPHFGVPANAAGFTDRDLPRERGGPLVAVIGDSFSIGAVSHPLHYTSVAEQELPAFEFYNVGIAGANPSHYLHLLEHEVLPLRPDAIVLAVFVGNDLEFEVPAAGPANPLGWLGDRRESFLARFVVRVRNISAERERAAGEDIPGASTPDVPASDGAVDAFPWFADPMLEIPTFSPAGFRKLERERALAVARPTEAYACFPWLERIHAAARDLPFVILLIPDEFQVEEDVWGEVLAEVAEPLERDLPQALMARFCRERNFALLDVLPALRAVPPLPDGRRHVYALRDTHWNARGNAVVGRELARAVAALLGR